MDAPLTDPESSHRSVHLRASSLTLSSAAVATGPLTTAEKISAWYTGGGETAINALSADLIAEQKAASTRDLPGTRAACVSLKSDIAGAKSYGPIPAADVQKSWSAGLAEMTKAANDCVRGVDNVDASLIRRSGNELIAGTKDITMAAKELQAY